MAVVKTATVHLNGTAFKKVYKVDGNGVFSIELPSWVADGMQANRKITGKTLDELDKKFASFIREYDALKTVVRKVIRYRFDLDLQNDEHELDSDNGKALGVRLYAAVYNETRVVTPEGSGRAKYSWVESSIPESAYSRDAERYTCMIVEWTQKLEDEFAKRVRQIEAITLEMRGFELSIVGGVASL